MHRRKLQKKILWGITGIAILSVLSILIAAETVFHNILREKFITKGVFMARHIAELSVNPILTEKHFELDMMIKDIMKREEGIAYIFIKDRENRILAHTFDGGFPVDLKKIGGSDPNREYDVKRITADREDINDIAVPVLRGSAGIVHLGISENSVRKDTNSVVRLILGIMLAILMMIYAIAIILSRRIIRPLVELSGMAEAVGEGDLTRRANVYADDEIGVLSRSFNEMVQKRSRAESERDALIADLQKALHQVKTLSGLLPMCAWCKKIRNDEGYWSNVDTYISEHTNADFTHGICPDCYRKVKGEID